MVQLEQTNHYILADNFLVRLAQLLMADIESAHFFQSISS